MSWEGLRTLRVARKVPDVAGVASLWLADPAGARLPRFVAGQFLTLSLDVPGQARPVVACYSLSSPPEGGEYRITVKALPGGRASRHLVHDLPEGALLRARGPAGRFTFDPRDADPAVLIGGGIGVTPFVSMLHAAAHAPGRDVTLVLGMRGGAEHPLRAEVDALARAAGARRHVSYSRPGPDDVLGRDHDRVGHVDAGLLAEVLPPADRPYVFYVCGPPAMTAAVTGGLRDLGVPDSQVRLELFGPATTRRLKAVRPDAGTPGASVTFARAGRTAAWDPALDSLLALAERERVPIPYACMVGRCGTCLTKLRDGRVRYPVAPAFPAPPGACLPCVALPDGPVVLDA